MPANRVQCVSNCINVPNGSGWCRWLAEWLDWWMNDCVRIAVVAMAPNLFIIRIRKWSLLASKRSIHWMSGLMRAAWNHQLYTLCLRIDHGPSSSFQWRATISGCADTVRCALTVNHVKRGTKVDRRTAVSTGMATHGMDDRLNRIFVWTSWAKNTRHLFVHFIFLVKCWPSNSQWNRMGKRTVLRISAAFWWNTVVTRFQN